MGSKKKKNATLKESKSVKTIRDAAVEAESITKPYDEQSQKRRQYAIQNAAAIISFLTVGLIIILYAFNRGYYGVYNIPIECVPIDLKSYIPVAIQAIGLAMIGLQYAMHLKTDSVLKKRRYNPLRVLYGTIILQSIIVNNNYHFLWNKLQLDIPFTDRYIPIGVVLSFLIPLAISAGIESFVYFSKTPIFRPNFDETVTKQVYEMRKEEFVFEHFYYSYYIKGGIALIILAVLLVPSLGKLSAKAKRKYPIISVDDALYAVILIEADRCLVQPAIVQEKQLRIDTSSFRYYNKNAGEIWYQQFEDVAME